jgi:2-polyprenyl-6-methoxyphenol hydroxylase-like FAD-dependent oxidoreductase
MSAASRRAAVVGAGQAGVTAALGLLDGGFEVAVFSDRDQRSLRDDVPATGAALIFGEAQEAEAALGLDTYTGRAPLHTGLSVRVVGPKSAELIGFDGVFRDYTGLAVDTRLKADERLAAFRERGGKFVVDAVTPEKLDRIAETHDLTLVATGRGGLSGLFAPDPNRTVYKRPQRSLLTVTVSGLDHDEHVFAHRSPEGGAHGGFSILLQQGEAWWGPYLHKDAGPAWAFVGWAKPGTEWEKRFQQAHDAESAHRIVVELYRDFIDWDLPEVLATKVIGEDPHSWLKGALTPVVRSGVGHTASGHPVASLGDASITHDPIAGQGAQGGLIQARLLVEAARSQQGPFDAAWIVQQYNAFLDARGDAATKVTRLFLRDPELAPYADLLFPIAQVSPKVASAVVGLLHRPQPLLSLRSETAARQFVAEIAGEDASALLARFEPVGRFSRSSFGGAARQIGEGASRFGRDDG